MDNSSQQSVTEFEFFAATAQPLFLKGLPLFEYQS